MGGWMCELVLFIVTVVESYEYSKIMVSWRNPHACAGKFGAQLVESPSRETFLRAGNVEG